MIVSISLIKFPQMKSYSKDSSSNISCLLKINYCKSDNIVFTML